jgi:hypothetical protein
MYLPGLMADEQQITRQQLEDWADNAYWSYLSEYAVPWVATETDDGFELDLKWIRSEKESFASAGWGTLAYYAAGNEDEKLDTKIYIKLLETVKTEIHTVLQKKSEKLMLTWEELLVKCPSYTTI